MEVLEYNNNREDLVISEYGRNIHKMVEYCMTVPEKEERNKIAKAIISVMGQLFPYLRDSDDWTHKLWDHLYIISDFKLDVDSPYPIPDRGELTESKPDRVPYPQKKIKHGHYGRGVEELIRKASEFEEGDEKNVLTILIANLMKKNFLIWNRNNVNDKVIKEQLRSMSNGKLILDESVQLISAKEVVGDKKPTHSKSKNKSKNNNHSKNKKYTKRRY